MTAKVLEAVPDTGHGLQADAKSRTAWELATHLATADVWFLQSVIDGAFNWDPEGAKQAAAQFESVKDVVAFYQREVPARLAALRALPGDRWPAGGLLRHDAAAAAWFIGMANNHSTHHRGSWRRTCARWARRCRRSTATSADYPMQAAGVIHAGWSFPDLRAFLGQLPAVTAASSRWMRPWTTRLEVAEIIARVIAAGGPALLFTNVTGSDFRLRRPIYSGRRGARSSRSASGRVLLIKRRVELAETLMPADTRQAVGARATSVWSGSRSARAGCRAGPVDRARHLRRPGLRSAAYDHLVA
jgi:hypothetical protein